MIKAYQLLLLKGAICSTIKIVAKDAVRLETMKTLACNTGPFKGAKLIKGSFTGKIQTCKR